MTALQVRDFPDELYQRLRVRAERDHRSIAQQTIVAVEEMLGERSCEHAERRSARSVYRPRFSSDRERAARIEKRKRIFERLDACADACQPVLDDEQITALIRSSRDERTDGILESSGLPVGSGKGIEFGNAPGAGCATGSERGVCGCDVSSRNDLFQEA